MRACCSICSDVFDEVNSISAAPCGHVYHSNCLMLWLNQAKSCPECRLQISQRNVLKLYFNFPSTSSLNSSVLENEIGNLKALLCAKNAELEASKREKEVAVAYVREAEKLAADLQQTAYKNEATITKLRLKIKSLSSLGAKVLKLEQMNVALNNDLQHLNNVQLIVSGTQKDADDILKEYSSNSEAAKQMATYCTVLKRELTKVMESKSKLHEQNLRLKTENGRFAAKVKFYDDAMCLPSDSSLFDSKFTKRKEILKVNNCQSPSTPVPSQNKASSSNVVDISPLDVPFNKLKFSMHVVPHNVPSTTCLANPKENKMRIMPMTASKDNGEQSIVKTGYNGFGGHSNYITMSSDIKKFKNLKRKNK